MLKNLPDIGHATRYAIWDGRMHATLVKDAMTKRSKCHGNMVQGQKVV